jgi:hypothetical protein
VARGHAAMSFSLARGTSRKVCIGVLPKHQRPWCGRHSRIGAVSIAARARTCRSVTLVTAMEATLADAGEARGGDVGQSRTPELVDRL